MNIGSPIVNPDRITALGDRLRSIAEDLDEVMFDELREASSAGRQRPETDKKLLAIRRSIDKAIGLIDSVVLGATPGDDAE